MFGVLSIFQCRDADRGQFDKSSASAVSKAEIVKLLQNDEPALTSVDICLSDRIIWPAYMGFSALIDCDSIDYLNIVNEIYKGNSCEEQYVYNLQHQYDDPWEHDIGKFTFLKPINLDSCLYTIFFSDFQNGHVYAALVSRKQLVESEGPMLLFGKAKEFMIKFSDTGGRVDWIKTTEIVDSSLYLPSAQ
ncbi:hypothetical protein GGR26_001740 [Lewinella marina]|uniref:hypothetical protein n=1 Tax=Neolewinella marina TaxID=438751 RepID=UPI00117B499B|nr:hypothetical protein [Neolewinella marina]NJB85972.1 hypothetical protein [Neolewinella marina]